MVTFRALVAAAAISQFLSIATALAAPPNSNISSSSSSSCRCMPGDSCWPSRQEWAQLNHTVGGRLISNVPLAHVCHDPTYDEEECNYLREQWKWPVIQ